MKNFRTKFLVALFSFIIGVSAFYLIPNIRLLIAFDNFNSVRPNSTSSPVEISLPEQKLSNKIEIRFVRFVRGERQAEAELEVTNNTAENVYYSSFFKNSYAFPTLKRDGKVVIDSRFRCGTGLTEQTLSPGEVVVFRILKSEVTYEPTKDSWREPDKPTQIGFSFEIGNKPLVRVGNYPRETFWSEEIKFPN
jgi:hypothetical protein